MRFRLAMYLVLCSAGLLGTSAVAATAQELTAVDDTFAIPYGLPLVVDAFGVLENDVLDGENAGETGATAELVVDVSHGTLTLSPDGSFSYSPGPSFDGSDSFVYRAVFAAVSSQATVSLSACEGGPDVFTCWNETAFLTKAAELGLFSFREGFEDDNAWGIARSPISAPLVISRGIQWQSNHPDAPASNNITTGPGPARTGAWAIFDPDHGYATGTLGGCDVVAPPPNCYYHDGFTGIRLPGLSSLQGVGGWVTGHDANLRILLDNGGPLGGGHFFNEHQFFGVIDASPAGFTRFEFRDIDGKIGQAALVFGDDFTILTADPTAVSEPFGADSQVFFAGASPNPSNGRTTLYFSLATRSSVRLSTYDQRGRRIRDLLPLNLEAGAHGIDWDGKDQSGRPVAAGTYFGRLIVDDGRRSGRYTKKLVVVP